MVMHLAIQVLNILLLTLKEWSLDFANIKIDRFMALDDLDSVMRSLRTLMFINMNRTRSSVNRCFLFTNHTLSLRPFLNSFSLSVID